MGNANRNTKVERIDDPSYGGRSKKKKKLKKRLPIGVRILLGFIMVVFSILFIAAGIGYGAYLGIAAGTPEFESINVMPTQYPSTIVDCNGNEIIQLAAAGAKRVDVAYEDLPEHVKWAFVDIEDVRFYEHNGVDIRGMLRAIKNRFTKGTAEGASTITQQLIKNNVFNTGLLERSDGSTIKRKIQEQILAVELEKHMTKDEILTTYLNTINLGGGNYGIVTAAEYYFGKDVKDLTISEAAVLAGITKNPTYNNPATHPDRNRERQVAVLDSMLEQGHITQEEYDEAYADDVYSRISQNTIVEEANSKYSYFVDALISDVIYDLQNDLGYSYQQAYNAVFNGGLTICATQDMDIQNIVDTEVNNNENYPGDITYGISWNLSVQHANGEMQYYYQNHIAVYFQDLYQDASYRLNFATQEEAQAAVDQYKATILAEDDTVTYEELYFTIQPQMSVTIIDYRTGQVKALIGGRGDKATNMSLNRATDTYRQPGSCFKILAAYAPAMNENVVTLGTAIDDSPFNYGGDINRDVRNWWGDSYRGLCTPRDGIRDSMNVLAVKTMYMTGATTSLEYLKSFGITSIDEVEDAGVSTALGGITKGVSNIELNAAYCAIANDGVYREPILYTQILNKDGSVFYDKTSTQDVHEVLRPAVASLLTNAMQDVITSGTGTAAAIEGTPVAGKTGTTTDTIDLWFCGYVPNGLCAAVWTGYDQNVQITTEEIYHETMYSNIMSQVLAIKGLEGGEFTLADGIYQDTICTKSGQYPTDLCNKDGTVRSEYFEEGTGPDSACTTHYTCEVCAVTGKLPSATCQKTTKICIKRPMDVTGTDPKGTTEDSDKSPPTETCDGKHGTVQVTTQPATTVTP